MIANLEIPYLGILDQYRPQLALHRRVVREPSLFADVIAQAFRRADGEAEESVDDHMLERRASAAFNLLWELRLLPGLTDDGSVDVEAISTWVNESRRMCRERDRKDIGDQQNWTDTGECSLWAKTASGLANLCATCWIILRHTPYRDWLHQRQDEASRCDVEGCVRRWWTGKVARRQISSGCG